MALEFNGTSNFVRVPRKTALEPAAVSLCAWLKRMRTPAAADALTPISKSFDLASTAPFSSFDFEFPGTATTSISFGVGISTTLQILMSTAGVITNGVWVHVVGTYDPNVAAPQQRLYINGVQNNARTQTGAINYDTTPNGDLFFGQDGSSGNQQFRYPGLTADIRIYNRMLTAAEVQQLYTARGHDGIYRGLVGRWPCRERADGQNCVGTGFVKDVSETNTVGTPTNTPVYRNNELSFDRKFVNVQG